MMSIEFRARSSLNSRRLRFFGVGWLILGFTLTANGKEEAPSVVPPKPVVLQPSVAPPPPPAVPTPDVSLAVKKPSSPKKAHSKKPDKKPAKPRGKPRHR